MFEYLDLGPTPAEEECAQVGEEDYSYRARHECMAYINQLKRIMRDNGYPENEWPDGFSLKMKGHSHDYGTYYEVAARYDANDEKAVDLAFWLESNLPSEWDELAKQELNIGNKQFDC